MPLPKRQRRTGTGKRRSGNVKPSGKILLSWPLLIERMKLRLSVANTQIGAAQRATVEPCLLKGAVTRGRNKNRPDFKPFVIRCQASSPLKNVENHCRTRLSASRLCSFLHSTRALRRFPLEPPREALDHSAAYCLLGCYAFPC